MAHNAILTVRGVCILFVCVYVYVYVYACTSVCFFVVMCVRVFLSLNSPQQKKGAMAKTTIKCDCLYVCVCAFVCVAKTAMKKRDCNTHSVREKYTECVYVGESEREKSLCDEMRI